jgi:hypothetical protein
VCEISKEMKYGAFNIIPKANDKIFNGNLQHLHDSRKLAYGNHK